MKLVKVLFFKPSFILYRFFTLISVLFISSCVNNLSTNLSSNVTVLVYPYGQGAKRSSRSPLLFLSPGKKICRRTPYNQSKARKYLEDSLDEEFLDRFFPVSNQGTKPPSGGSGNSGSGAGAGAGSSGSGTGAGAGASSTANNKPVQIDVAANWIEFGLLIANNNKNKNAYKLFVHSISYVATARCGQEVFEHSGDISTTKCQSDQGVTSPFLYFVPAGSKVDFKPYSTNSFENLKLFIDGFEIIDRAKESNRPPLIAGTQKIISNPTCYPNKIKHIPNYLVELTLIGQFISKSGFTVAEFIKRVHFRTRSTSF